MSRVDDAVRYRAQLVKAQRAIGGLFISEDVQARANALSMVLRIAEAEINDVIRFEDEQAHEAKEADNAKP